MYCHLCLYLINHINFTFNRNVLCVCVMFTELCDICIKVRCKLVCKLDLEIWVRGHSRSFSRLHMRSHSHSIVTVASPYFV